MCMYIYIYIHIRPLVDQLVLQHQSQRPRVPREPEAELVQAKPLYADSTIISPTIISEKPLTCSTTSCQRG